MSAQANRTWPSVVWSVDGVRPGRGRRGDGYAVAAGLPGVTIATGATVSRNYNPAHISELFDGAGYDVTTGYNYHAMGGEVVSVGAYCTDPVSRQSSVD